MSQYTSVAPFLQPRHGEVCRRERCAILYEHVRHGASQLRLNNGNKWTESVRHGIAVGVHVVNANCVEVFAGGLPASALEGA